jgi:hypothetical protein
MNDTNISAICFRIVLGFLGCYVIFLGLNNALGGLYTLGWMSDIAYFEVIHTEKFLEMDSHYRFYGGLWTAIGLFVILGVTNLEKYQSGLNLVFAIISIGGISRFSQMNIDVLLTPKIAGLLGIEILLMFVLYLWLAKILKRG